MFNLFIVILILFIFRGKIKIKKRNKSTVDPDPDPYPRSKLHDCCDLTTARSSVTPLHDRLMDLVFAILIVLEKIIGAY